MNGQACDINTSPMATRQNEKRNTIAQVLKTAIRESGMSYVEMETGTGVNCLSIARFMRGDSLRLDIADKLVVHLGIEVKRKVE